MDRQGTWEILLLPVGKEAGKGIASVKIQTPVRRLTRLPSGGTGLCWYCAENWRLPISALILSRVSRGIGRLLVTVNPSRVTEADLAWTLDQGVTCFRVSLARNTAAGGRA